MVKSTLNQGVQIALCSIKMIRSDKICWSTEKGAILIFRISLVIISQMLHLHFSLGLVSAVQMRSAINHVVVCLWGMRDMDSQSGPSIMSHDQNTCFLLVNGVKWPEHYAFMIICLNTKHCLQCPILPYNLMQIQTLIN